MDRVVKVRPVFMLTVRLLISSAVLYFPFCRPVTEATKPPQQLTTPNSSGDVNVTSLIAKLLTGYDKRLRPQFGGKDNDLCLIFIQSVCLTTTTIECSA